MEKNPWVMAVGGLIVGLVIGYFVGTSGKTAVPQETVTNKTATGQVKTQTTGIMFVNHIQADLPEQDVFIEETEGSDQVVRVDVEDGNDPGNLGKSVFASAEFVEHDPFKLGENPLGPFAKGEPLGFMLGDWLAATGSGTYTVTEDGAEIDLSLQKLVPNGVYTVWCSRITFPPNVAVVDRPCGKADGSENTFTADESGIGTYNVMLSSPLEESTKETVSVIALAYHSDGKTSGADPGEFGKVTHVQVFYILPAPSK